MSPRDDDTATKEGGDFLKVRQIADELQCGAKPIFKAIKSGELRSFVLNERGDVRVHRSWLVDWVERRANHPRQRSARLREVLGERAGRREARPA